MRAFIAIELNKEIKNNLAQIQTYFRKDYPEIRWVPPQNFHLTLKFLGEVNAGDLQDIKSKLTVISSGFRPFAVRLKGAGFFPGSYNPKVFWAGIIAEPELFIFAEKINSSITQGDNKKFSPHITLARFNRKFTCGEELLNRIKSQVPEGWGGMQVGCVNLMESILRPGGPIYRRIYTISL
ncbi:MAG: RNA 2',3'-cyclic phosphodiesterase [Desulfitobacteriaceae bacterium]|nr:RNA 2',3'-cyclic phosphodiesterase [Desulfitobacteriaceae bacterium]MDD4751806.1 RNA 2',3'-cyclic phosphodiesterase [Desulfitobacteriaceae bacterium]